MNSLKKGEGVPLLNFEGGPGVPLLNFEGDPGVPLLNFEGGPGVLAPLLHHAVWNIYFTFCLAVVDCTFLVEYWRVTSWKYSHSNIA